MLKSENGSKDAQNEEEKQNKKMYELQQSSPYKNIESSPDSLESGRH